MSRINAEKLTFKTTLAIHQFTNKLKLLDISYNRNMRGDIIILNDNELSIRTMDESQLESQNLTVSNANSFAIPILSLHTLILEGMNLYDASFRGLVEIYPNLTYLDLQYNPDITHHGIQALASCPKLQVLNLNRCRKVDDQCVQLIASHCNMLTSLNLTYCDLITDSAILSLGQFTKNLRELNVDYNHRLTNYGLQHLLECSKRI